MGLIKYDMSPRIEAFSISDEKKLPYDVLQMHQVHGDKIAVINDNQVTHEELYGFDAIITNLKNFAIGVRTADCVPILLYDKKQDVIAAIHSGWKGTVLKISKKVIEKMKKDFLTVPTDVCAVIGPSISMDFYQVGVNVYNEFKYAGFPMSQISYKNGDTIEGILHSGYHIDLIKANEWLLLESGLLCENIKKARICTFQNHDEWNSARWTLNNKCPRNINSIKILK